MYNDDLTWIELNKMTSHMASNTITTLVDGLILYNKWQSFCAGRSNATIATALAKTEAQVAEMGAAIGAMKELYDAANNVATYTGDRFYSLRKF